MNPSVPCQDRSSLQRVLPLFSFFSTVPLFHAQIDMPTLLHMTDEDLKELGIPMVSPTVCM